MYTKASPHLVNTHALAPACLTASSAQWHARAKSLQIALATSALLGVGTSAHAVTYDFVVSGDYSAHFLIDSSPAVNVLDPAAFSVEGVAGTFAGIVGLRNVTFYTPAASGGMAINSTDPYVGEMSVFGVQVFTGPISAPTFVLGTYDFVGFVGPDDGKVVRLVISAVPEPETWLSMLAGMLVLGAVARSRVPVSER